MNLRADATLAAARELDMVVDQWVGENPEQAQQVAEITAHRFRDSTDDVVAEEVASKVRLVRAHGLEPWLRSIRGIR